MTEIRPARPDDLEPLIAIHNHWVRHSVATLDAEPNTAESRRPWFESFASTGPHRLLVAVSDGRVVGCASSGRYREHPAFAGTVEFGIQLDPECRGAGIGSDLYRRLIEELRSEPVHMAVAGIVLPNDASIALHRRFGFREVGVFREYAVKNGALVSALWMQRSLDGEADGGEAGDPAGTSS
ncbi:MAG TPA: GNAT family N-acetyltransferase [Candidatus Dormibacteraeota bacterium]|jgi:phosphinothricin acetyltransferase|nr:GNAT family N-acetyltransferase [Candidatus Dormibacteraeota bacterium]